MKKNTFLLCLLLFCMQAANAQLTKGNWLVGGNASFAFTSYNSDATKLSETSLSPNAGYFFIDKLAFGMRLGYSRSYTKFKSNAGQPTNNFFKSSTYGIGPYMRYYFLPVENRYNILAEGSYQYSSSKQVTNTSSTPSFPSSKFSIAAGPIIFLNSSVGLEFLIGYTSTPKNKNSDKSYKVGVGIGIQVHLEKEKL